MTDTEILDKAEPVLYELFEKAESMMECTYCYGVIKAETIDKAAADHDDDCVIGKLRRLFDGRGK